MSSNTPFISFRTYKPFDISSLHLSLLVIDTIYRRGADLLRIDEKLIRHSSGGSASSKTSIGEALQLVHYDKSQQYTAHQ